MGHIELAAPVVHIWFFKSSPSRLGALLDLKTTQLEKVIYFQDFLNQWSCSDNHEFIYSQNLAIEQELKN